MRRTLHIGGLVAMGFSKDARYLLTISHSGRGVFDMRTWERVAREAELAYPENDIGIGIGPIDQEPIPAKEIDYDSEKLETVDAAGRFRFLYDGGIVEILEIEK